jgi:hypothetical protein
MGNGVIAPQFLTPALDGCDWSASRPCRFYPRNDWIGGWVSLRTRPEAVKIKISCT